MSNIAIKNVECAEIEALAKCLDRCCWWIKDAEKIEIYVSPRVAADAPAYKDPGLLEYGMLVHFQGGTEMYVVMIQRQIGAIYEFHS